MSQLSREQVLKLARLSRLSLSDDEVVLYQKELSAILGYVERLDAVSVDGLKPTYQVTGLQNVEREDVVKESRAKPSELLKSAPKSRDGYIEVNRMI